MKPAIENLTAALRAAFPGADLLPHPLGGVKVVLAPEHGFYIDEERGRFVITGVNPSRALPSGNYGPLVLPRDAGIKDYATVRITTSKTPEQVVGDINRRFLPDYKEKHAIVVAKRDADDECVRNENRVAQLIAGNLRTLATGINGLQSPRRNKVRFNLAAGPYGTSETNADRTYFKVDYLTADQAVRLAAFLGNL